MEILKKSQHIPSFKPLSLEGTHNTPIYNPASPLISQVLLKSELSRLYSGLNGNIPAINLIRNPTGTESYPFSVRVNLVSLPSGQYSDSQDVSKLANPILSSKKQFLTSNSPEYYFENTEYGSCHSVIKNNLVFLVNGLIWTIPSEIPTFSKLLESL